LLEAAGSSGGFPLSMRLAAVLIVCVAPAAAQLRSVDIRVSGLDCASCAESVAKRLGRIRGVESASFDRNMASVKLREENAVTLHAIRDALKGLGYTPEEARIVVRGELRDGVLSLPNEKNAFSIDGSPPKNGVVVLEGDVAAGSTRLIVRK
jgi:copper chaperone CopZ